MDNIIIFSDGSSRRNPGPGGWGAIVSDGRNVSELGGREEYTTNNKMELSGAINALKEINSKKSIVLNTDSSYVINGMTKWIFGWQKNGWRNSMKEEVANRALWEELIKVSENKKIKWNYVAGHADIPGNERCDEIATTFADNKKIDLYAGKASEYDVDLTKTKGVAKAGKKKSKSGMAYSYLSLVDGVFKIDKTWAECEKRVKGKRGAKYQKALSEIEEKEIMKKWSVK